MVLERPDAQSVARQHERDVISAVAEPGGGVITTMRTARSPASSTLGGHR
jgi:hypothetical protein